MKETSKLIMTINAIVDLTTDYHNYFKYIKQPMLLTQGTRKRLKKDASKIEMTFIDVNDSLTMKTSIQWRKMY